MQTETETESVVETGNGARIPALSVQLDAEEDLFVSEEIGQGRVTGGPKTRAAVMKRALRFFMEARRRGRIE